MNPFLYPIIAVITKNMTQMMSIEKKFKKNPPYKRRYYNI